MGELIKATVSSIAIGAALAAGCAAHRKQARFDAAVAVHVEAAANIDALARRLRTLTNIHLLDSARDNLAAARRFLDGAALDPNEERARLRGLVEIDLERVADMAASLGSEEIGRLLQHTYELRRQAAELRYRR